jgi:hypothetical protein
MDQHLRTYLFTEGSILDIEHEAEHEDGGDEDDEGRSLGIGSLKGEGQL